MSLAIITGASSGIGCEFSRQLRQRGIDRFWLIARRRDRLEELAEELSCECEVISADLSCESGIGAVKNILKEKQPRVDYLVSAAGFGEFGAQDELTPDEAARVIEVNVRALVEITNAALPYMAGGGRIIELGSASAFTPLPYFATYAASKSFVLHYSKALYYELRPRDIHVSCICPGWVHTEFIDKATDTSGLTRPRRDKLKPLLRCEKTVRLALRASDRKKKIYVVGLFYKMQHLLFKILPDGILSRAWLLMIDKKALKDRQKRYE